MLFIKLIKVQNLTCSKFKHNKNILMLCNKIELNESERFTQTRKSKINEPECFTQTRMGIHIFALLSESYIQIKNLQTIVLHRFTENLEVPYSCRQANFKES